MPPPHVLRYDRSVKTYLTSGDVCRATGLGYTHVAKLCRDGSLKGFRLGDGSRVHQRIHRASVVAYLRQRGLPDDLVPADLVFDILMLGVSKSLVDAIASSLPDDTFRVRTGGDFTPRAVVVDGTSLGLAASWSRRVPVIGIAPEHEAADWLKVHCTVVLRHPVAPSDLTDVLRKMVT